MAEPTVFDIVEAIFGRIPGPITPIRGQGVANHVWEIRDGGDAYILKSNKNPQDESTFRKEAWCMTAARKAGLSGALPTGMGRLGATDWMMQTKIEGIAGNLWQGDRKTLWREMGRAAALLNSIPVEGFGTSAVFKNDVPVFDQPTWERNIRSLESDVFTDDILVRSGALTLAQNEQAKSIVAQIRKWDFKPVLSHHDILPQNTIVGWGGRTNLIDYGLAGGGRGAISELATICAFAKDPGAAQAFCEGYGMSPSEYRDMLPELQQILLLRVLLHARWAAYYQVEDMDSHIAYAREKAQALLEPAAPVIQMPRAAIA
ncbi:MAG TPA: phosphotransferase [Patescibacteria group bacterium]|nr:phosphotransferase [Patescibacteria group bacterium]